MNPSSHLQAELIASYAAIRNQIKVGDVIAFSGYDLPSTVVKVATQSSYVHVAIVVSIQHTSEFGDSIVIAESHIDASLPSVITGEKIRGVQSQWLFDRLITQAGPAWWAPLKTPLSDEGMAQMQSWLHNLEQQKIPFDFLQAIGAGLDILDPLGVKNEMDFSAIFCAELVTRALQIAGALEESINPAEQTPVDVMHFPCFEEPILIKEA